MPRSAAGDGVTELVGALLEGEHPPASWVARWARPGRDPVRVAWQESDAGGGWRRLIRGTPLRGVFIPDDTRHCWIEETATGFVLFPTHNGGNRGDRSGFAPLEDCAVRIGRHASAAELGAALRKAFELCT